MWSFTALSLPRRMNKTVAHRATVRDWHWAVEFHTWVASPPVGDGSGCSVPFRSPLHLSPRFFSDLIEVFDNGCVYVWKCAKWNTMKHILIYSPSMSFLSQICIVLALFGNDKNNNGACGDNKSRIFIVRIWNWQEEQTCHYRETHPVFDQANNHSITRCVTCL